jgi:hypothetical protein
MEKAARGKETGRKPCTVHCVMCVHQRRIDSLDFFSFPQSRVAPESHKAELLSQKNNQPTPTPEKLKKPEWRGGGRRLPSQRSPLPQRRHLRHSMITRVSPLSP